MTRAQRPLPWLILILVLSLLCVSALAETTDVTMAEPTTTVTTVATTTKIPTTVATTAEPTAVTQAITTAVTQPIVGGGTPHHMAGTAWFCACRDKHIRRLS